METPAPKPTSKRRNRGIIFWTKDALLARAKIELPHYFSVLKAEHDLNLGDDFITRKRNNGRCSLPYDASPDMLLVGHYETLQQDSNSPVYAFVGGRKNIIGYAVMESNGNHKYLNQSAWLGDIAYQEPLCHIRKAFRDDVIACYALDAFILIRFLFKGCIPYICNYESLWPDLNRACKTIAESEDIQCQTIESSVHGLGADKEAFSKNWTNSNPAAVTCGDQKKAVPQLEATKDKGIQMKRKHDGVDDLKTCKYTKEDTCPPLLTH